MVLTDEQRWHIIEQRIAPHPKPVKAVAQELGCCASTVSQACKDYRRFGLPWNPNAGHRSQPLSSPMRQTLEADLVLHPAASWEEHARAVADKHGASVDPDRLMNTVVGAWRQVEPTPSPNNVFVLPDDPFSTKSPPGKQTADMDIDDTPALLKGEDGKPTRAALEPIVQLILQPPSSPDIPLALMEQDDKAPLDYKTPAPMHLLDCQVLETAAAALEGTAHPKRIDEEWAAKDDLTATLLSYHAAAQQLFTAKQGKAVSAILHDGEQWLAEHPRASGRECRCKREEIEQAVRDFF